MDAQIEKVIAEVAKESFTWCDDSKEAGELITDGLRELAQRVLEIAALKTLERAGCAGSSLAHPNENCHEVAAREMRSLASDGAAKEKI